MPSKLLVLDVDGVLTDGTKLYGVDGSTIGKSFCDHDFTAIRKFMEDGWLVVWLSADRVINEKIAKSRNILFVSSREPDNSIDKIKPLQQLIAEHHINPRMVVYMGDDLFDIPIFRAVKAMGGKAYCPANAVQAIKDTASLVLSNDGGHGAVMDLYWLYKKDIEPPCELRSTAT